MIDHRQRALLSAFAVVAFAVPASAARFDGAWAMTAVTTRGHCGTIPVGMLISRGEFLRPADPTLSIPSAWAAACPRLEARR